MKAIDLIMLQGTKLPVIQLFGVYKGNSGTPTIQAEFDGDAYIKNLTTNEKTYLTSGEEVEWHISRQAPDYIIVGKITELLLSIEEPGPGNNYIQEIRFNNAKCDKFVYNAFCSSVDPRRPTIPTITGNKYVKEMELTIFGNGASSSSVYEIGTFLQTLSRYNGSSLGTLKMESGFVNIDNINVATGKNYLLSPL